LIQPVGLLVSREKLSHAGNDMPSQWIRAPLAIALLEELTGEKTVRRTLLNRARAGALKAWARTLDIEGDNRTDVFLKPGFWDWDRYGEYQEHWDVGDFSVTIDGLRHHAIGVSFDFAGVCDMLPLERRPELARKVSVAGDAAWVTAKAARAFMYNELGAVPTHAGENLLEQCRLGFVAARAVLRKQAKENEPDRWFIEERESDIPLWFWVNFTDVATSQQDWERGVFTGRGAAPNGAFWITLNGVHFLRASLEAMLPGSRSNVALPVPSAGGRPPAAFWDDLWCAIWGQIYRAELVPSRQADIERAMLDWASTNDHDLSETAAKARARKLFAEYQSEGRNSRT
jgi:hypothetical protein